MTRNPQQRSAKSLAKLDELAAKDLADARDLWGQNARDRARREARRSKRRTKR